MTVNQLVVSEKKLEIIFVQKLLIAHDELMNEEGKMGINVFNCCNIRLKNHTTLIYELDL